MCCAIGIIPYHILFTLFVFCSVYFIDQTLAALSCMYKYAAYLWALEKYLIRLPYVSYNDVETMIAWHLFSIGKKMTIAIHHKMKGQTTYLPLYRMLLSIRRKPRVYIEFNPANVSKDIFHYFLIGALLYLRILIWS